MFLKGGRINKDYYPSLQNTKMKHNGAYAERGCELEI